MVHYDPVLQEMVPDLSGVYPAPPVYSPYPASIECHSSWIEVFDSMFGHQFPTDFGTDAVTNPFLQLVLSGQASAGQDGQSNQRLYAQAGRCGPWLVVVTSAEQAAAVQQPRVPPFALSLSDFPRWNLQFDNPWCDSVRAAR
jgi:hypothetical protein